MCICVDFVMDEQSNYQGKCKQKLFFKEHN
jgi:hypothetical protein